MMKPNAMRTGFSTYRRTACIRLSEDFETVLDAEQANRTKAHGNQQDNALEQRLPQWRQIEHEQEVVDRAQDEGPENRTDGAAGAAIE